MQTRGVKTLDFAGTKEEVYERNDWPREKFQVTFPSRFKSFDRIRIISKMILLHLSVTDHKGITQLRDIFANLDMVKD